jgi:purine catabolism regulator
MRLTLGHLLAQEALALDLVAGGPGAADVALAGAHPIEIEAPSRWLPPGWLMLTTGLRLRGRADEQRRLVAELHDHGQAGLAWGIGLVVQQVPRAILAEADRVGLSVVTIPVHVPFRDVIAYVNGSLVSDELYVMRRVVPMQDYLVDALGADGPAAAILQLIGDLLGGPRRRNGAGGEWFGCGAGTHTPMLLRGREGKGLTFERGAR